MADINQETERNIPWRALLRGASIAAGLGIGGAGYAMLHEPLTIKLTRFSVRLPRAAHQLPVDGLRILHISDTHFQGFQWRELPKIRRIAALTQGLDYDLLVHTGDFWHNEAGLDNLKRLLNVLPRPKLGAFGVLGNHDYACYSHSDMLTRNWQRYREQGTARLPAAAGATNGHSLLDGAVNGAVNDEETGAAVGTTVGTTVGTAVGAAVGTTVAAPLTDGRVRSLADAIERVRDVYLFGRYFLSVPFDLMRVHANNIGLLERTLSDCGMTLLHNSAQSLCINAPSGPTQLFVAGVDDVSEGRPDVAAALSTVPNGAPTLLLSHNPDILSDPNIERADLVLAGHTHGGQISLPGIGPLHTHSQYLSRKQAAGRLKRGDTHVFVSRGVGEGIPLRFAAQPQIALITITA